MEQFKRVYSTIGSQLSSLTASQRLLILSVAVVLVMTLFVVQQYAGTPSMAPLLDAGYSPEDQQAAARYLDNAGIAYETDSDGTVLVAHGDRHRVIAQMSQQPGTLPSDTTLLFNNLIDQQSWTKSYQQNHQLMVIATQNELSTIIGQWPGIRSAKVIIDVPAKRALNAPRTRPTAAVSVEGESALTQDQVDAIAYLVAGARSGLEADRVRVIDAKTNTQRRARAGDELTATDTQELVAVIERSAREKLVDMLSPYIPGVLVTVHAQVDATRQRVQKRAVSPEGRGTVSVPLSEQTMERRETRAQRGGEPGARPNVQADITTGGGAATGMEETQGETAFETEFGTETTDIVDPRGFARKMNAVVNIPRPYFVSIWRAGRARAAAADGGGGAGGEGAAADPTDADLQPIVDRELARITAEVEKVVDTSTQDGGEPGEVSVSMIPVAPDFGLPSERQEAGGFFGLGSGGSGGVSSPMVELVKTAALGGMALIALGLVVFTAVKANKQEKLPSAHELVGIPPALEADDDLVGEAEAAEPALAGIELSESEMKQRKVLEQVAGMISEQPEDAAKLLGRWMAEDH